MKIIILSLLLANLLYSQNEHLATIDMTKMNYTKQKVKNWYDGSKKFGLAKEEPGMLVYSGGDCFSDWPVYFTIYLFNERDSVKQVVVTLADTTKDQAFLFPEVLNSFRKWYGMEIDAKEEDDGMRYYYWYFGDEMKEADRLMFISKNIKRTTPTIITQVDLRRVKFEDIK